MTPGQREALDAVERYGSQRWAAKELGICRAALQERLARAKKWQDAPDGQKAALRLRCDPQGSWVWVTISKSTSKTT